MQFGNAAEQYDHLRRMQIVDATQEIARAAPFEAVTVTAICRAAQISRATFYRYFKDKYDIVQWLWNVPGELYLRQCGITLDWYESNLEMMRFTVRYHDLFCAAIKTVEDYNSLLKHGHRRRARYLAEAIQACDPSLLTDDVAFQIEFFVLAESQTFGRWMAQGMPEAPETLVRRIELCVPPQLHRLICDCLTANEGRCPPPRTEAATLDTRSRA